MTNAPTQETAEVLMNRHVKTVTEDLSLADVIQFLTSHDLSFAPVVRTENGRQLLVGVISEKDCMSRLAEDLFFGSPLPPRSVGTLMKRHPVCVAPETDLFSLSSLFTNHGLRHAPVTEEDGHLIGIVSRRDILRSLEKVAAGGERAIEARHRHPDPRLVSNLRYFGKG